MPSGRGGESAAQRLRDGGKEADDDGKLLGGAATRAVSAELIRPLRVHIMFGVDASFGKISLQLFEMLVKYDAGVQSVFSAQ